MIRYLRAFLRFIFLIIAVIGVGLLQTIIVSLGFPRSFFISAIWARSILFGLGIKLVVRGTPTLATPTLFIANHSSYLDIVILSALTRATFVSKASVANWPIFGWLSRVQGTIFIDRTRGQARKQADALADHAKAGGNLILFAEGTTSDGNRLLPLKSSLLGVAQYMQAVQPITLAFTAMDGLPPGRTFRYMYAWTGDESMPPHLIRLLLQGEMEVMVTFHTPITTDLDNRKALTQQLELQMREGLNNALHRAAA